MRVGWEESRTCGYSRTIQECHSACALHALQGRPSLWMVQGQVSALKSKELTILGWPGLNWERMHLVEWVCSRRSQDTAQEMHTSAWVMGLNNLQNVSQPEGSVRCRMKF